MAVSDISMITFGSNSYNLKDPSKYTKPPAGIPFSDLTSDVQESLGKADTALQAAAIEEFYETETTSGSVVTFDAPADGMPLKKLTVDIEPVQAGTGDPSPGNVRAISGWTGCKVQRAGRNLCGGEQMADDFIALVNDLNYAYKGEDEYGKYVAIVASNAVSGKAFIGNIPFSEHRAYTLILKARTTAANDTSLNLYAKYTSGGNIYVNKPSSSGAPATFAFVTDSSRTLFQVRAGYATGTTFIYYEESGIIDGSIAVSDFAPYTGDVYEYDFPDSAGTVYGGTLTINDDGTGVLTVDRELITLDGIVNNITGAWGDTQYGSALYFTGIGDRSRFRPSISNVLQYSASGYSLMPIYSFPGTSGSVATCTIVLPTGTTPAQGNQWLQDMVSAGTPVQVMRMLTSVDTYQLTAQQVLNTLYGENNIWADCGDIEVEHGAWLERLKVAIDKANSDLATLRASIAPIEDGATASRSYAAGEYFFRNGQFCVALVQIASAAVFTLNTNYQVTTGAEVLEHLTIDDSLSVSGAAADAKVTGDAISNLKSALDDIGENTEFQGTNLFDGNFDESGYFNANGNLSSSTFKRTSKYYEIPENATKIYAYLSTQTTVFALGFYDSTKTWTGAKNVNNATIKENVIPSNSKYFRVYTKPDWNGNCTLATSYVDSYIPYVEPENKFILNGAFKGKTIAFLGDSLIGNFNDYSAICSVLEVITDATIINCAFGGSRMAYVYSAYGDTTPGATGYVDGATDAEKNQVNQYRYWNTLSGYGLAQAIASGSWTVQENAVTNLTNGLAYFSARLSEIEAIDWTTIDYILWNYGTNDFVTKVKVSDVGNTANYFAFDNAYRKTIETILTAYPKIKIIPITAMWRWWSNSGTFVDDSSTHTENDYSGASRLLTSFVEMAKEVAKEYQLPCIDIYYNLGANKFNRLEFFNSTDGTHPNAEGRKKYANYIASQLNTLKTS